MYQRKLITKCPNLLNYILIETMPENLLLAERQIPRIGFGTLYITQQRGFGQPRENAIDILKEAAELGIKFFDTADSYGNGSAEEAIHDALYPYDGLLIATKGGYRHQSMGAWLPDARPSHLRSALEGSLKRLRLETIDLYQLHCVDSKVSYSDSIGTLVDMKNEGKIRYIGVSNVGLTHLKMARIETEIVSVQNAFNIQHGANSEVLDYCTENKIPFIPWMPLGDGGIPWTEPVLSKLAQKYSLRPAQIALASLFHISPMILPIPGTSSLKHLRENFAAAFINLETADLNLLCQRYRIKVML